MDRPFAESPLVRFHEQAVREVRRRLAGASVWRRLDAEEQADLDIAFLFELVMTLGSHHPKIISRIDVLSWACVVATRGEGLAHGEPIDLSATRLTAGRRFQPL